MSDFKAEIKTTLLAIEGRAPSDDDTVLLARLVPIVNNIAVYMGIVPQWALCIALRDNKPDETHVAECLWPVLYKKATIVFDRAQIRSMTDTEIIQTIVHEMLHLVIAPLDDMMREETGRNSYVFMHYSDLREGVTDAITNIMLKMLNGGELTTYISVRKEGT